MKGRDCNLQVTFSYERKLRLREIAYQRILTLDFTFTKCSYQNSELGHIRVDVAKIGSRISHISLEDGLCWEDMKRDLQNKGIWCSSKNELGNKASICLYKAQVSEREKEAHHFGG